ncbi:M16 family metallopeptidase [Campylobacter corcagiensis]|uniref:Insulinase family protein n=1 Tax=Campylobacter corcagiensis TaxID=1448857 RepID=A0A7M1LEC7_9BACT|nr:pitrilysin family protein [Campylobacter corcagiensis]QKF64932.1 peptidase, M16 family [Campylobacter corcagiensis]QOQ86908.1 insulinase family protein [Campylobacter corcagiensis]
MKVSEQNGVKVLYEFDQSLPVVTLRLIFCASGVVSEKKQGLAKLSAKLLNEGTKTKGLEFNKSLEIKAVEIYASCGFETFVIELNCLKEHFGFAYSKLLELLKDPNLDANILEKLKIITKGEIATNESDFDYIAKCELDKILHDGSNLAYPSSGSIKSVESINLDDICEFLGGLNLSNLHIVLAGDIKEQNFKELFEILPKGDKRELPKISTTNKMITKEISKPTEQAYIYFGAPFNATKDESYKASVSTFILGSSGFGSRLLEEIRVKRGLAYSAYARNSFTLTNSKIWGYMQTKLENKDSAISVIKDEFEHFVKYGVSDDELKAAKNFLLGSVPLQKETMFKRVAIRQKEFYDGYEFGEFERDLERIKALSLDGLNEFINTHHEITKLSFSIVTK